MTEVRKDIQTLRAIAVIFVVAYHFGVPGFSNGFIGVDIFFVLSGYLIMQVIETGQKAGLSGLWDFVESRVRRLYPALMTTILGCLVVGYLTQSPEDLLRLERHAALATVFLSNIAFWREAGYFDAASHSKALLHTWSLAVEGQYYVLFAGFMFALGKRLNRRVLIGVLALAALASLACSVTLTAKSPSAAFYLLPTRAWEFLCGALVALLQPTMRRESLYGNVGGLVMAACFAIPLLVRIPAGEFPGYWALLAIVPATVFLACGGLQSRCAFWQTAPGVFFGNISYSLYLWHWPVYVFARALGYVEGGWSFWIAMFFAATLLGSLSYRYVETPFRRNRKVWTRRRMFLAASVSIALSAPLMLMGTGTIGVGGDTLKPDVNVILAEVKNTNPRQAECFLGQEIKDPHRPLCRFGSGGASPSFLLWGDSHADSLMSAVGDAASEHSKAGMFAGYSGCPPLLSVGTSDRDPCTEFNARVFGYAANGSGIDSVIMVARWSYYLLGEVGATNQEAKVSFMREYAGIADVRQAYRASLLDTVCGIAANGKRVFLIGPVPEVGANVPGALAAPSLSWIQRVFGRDRDIRVSLDKYRQRNEFVLEVFREAEMRCGAVVLDTAATLCPGTTCRIAEMGRPLYRDGDHLSEYGASHLIPMFSKVFN